MRGIVTLCAVVGLCAPIAAQAQGRGRDVARIERDDHSKDKSREKDKEQDKEQDKAKDDKKHEHEARDEREHRTHDEASHRGERHDNGLHLGHERGRGHHKGRGRGHDHHDHDVARRDTGRTCIDANRDGRCDFRTDSSAAPRTTQRFPIPTTTPIPVPTPRTEPVRVPGTISTAPRVEPTTTRRLPAMVPVAMIDQKRRTSDQDQWLGTTNVSGRYVDADRNGTPEQITWLDGAGMVKQIWRDDDKNGRANSVAIYERGRLTHMVRE